MATSTGLVRVSPVRAVTRALREGVIDRTFNKCEREPVALFRPISHVGHHNVSDLRIGHGRPDTKRFRVPRQCSGPDCQALINASDVGIAVQVFCSVTVGTCLVERIAIKDGCLRSCPA